MIYLIKKKERDPCQGKGPFVKHVCKDTNYFLIRGYL